MKDRRLSRMLRFTMTLALSCSLLVFASCRISLPNDCTGKCYPSSPPISAVLVLFDASVSYADALRGMTNLGVQPAVFCGYPNEVAAGERCHLARSVTQATRCYGIRQQLSPLLLGIGQAAHFWP